MNRDYLHEEIVQDNGFYLVQSAHCDFKGVMEIKAVFFTIHHLPNDKLNLLKVDVNPSIVVLAVWELQLIMKEIYFE